MKKIFISIFMFLPLFVSAQNVLTPQQQLEQAQKQLEEAKKAVEAAKAAKAAAEKAAKKAAKEAAEKAAAEKAAAEKAAAEKLAAQKAAEKAAAEKAAAEKKRIEEKVAKLKAEAERLQKEADNIQTEAAKTVKEANEELKPSIANEPVTLPSKDNRPVVIDVPANDKTSGNANSESSANTGNQSAGNTSTTSGWVVPTVEKKVETKEVVKTATGVTLKKDPKYLEGAITTDEEGKVAFTLDTDANGKSAQQIYDIVYNYMQSLLNDKNNINNRVALVNPQEHVIANTMDEWWVFNASFISLDRTEVKYQLVAKIADNSLHLTFARINFSYEVGRSTGFRSPAEEVITDKYALTKKKNDLAKIYGKFRKATIDRKDQIFKEITNLVKQ